ncbi:MAG: hypothetical protein ACXVPU_11640 [Bacteroidia bacterium]
MDNIIKCSLVSFISPVRYSQTIFLNTSSMDYYKRKSKTLSLLILITLNAFFILKMHSQNFSYSLQKDSSVYSSLNEATIISSDQNFQSKSFGIRLPFQFNFCGSNTDSITIEGNGFIILNNAKGLSIVSFNNFTSQKDTNENYRSSIGYVVSGNAGNKIIKIEFKDLAQTKLSSSDNLDYQIWLYENGNKIEFHIGPNPNSVDNEIPVLVGLINRNMDTDNKAYVISGNSSYPVGSLISGEASLEYIYSIPNTNIIYTLTPSF